MDILKEKVSDYIVIEMFQEFPLIIKVDDLKEEVHKNVKSESASKIADSLHSDNVNMIMEIFEGKVID